MPSKLVAVNDGLHLPLAVQAQLKADLQSDFETLVTEAETAAGSATSAAISADTSADIAVAAAASATAPTDAAVADLFTTASATRTAADNRYIHATHVKEFGAVGDGTTDDRVAIRAAIESGLPLYWGDSDDTYRITAMITPTVTKDIYWYSSGASIVVDPTATHMQRMFTMTVDAIETVHIDGPLLLDGSDKSNTGMYFVNSGTGTRFTAKDLSLTNFYRANTTFSGGDGITIRGNFTNVYLENPYVKNVHMAAGAGVSGSQGVAGITITHNGTGLAPGEITILNPYVENVYSDDITYFMDQDGIRIFTEEDSGTQTLYPTHFSIIGGLIKNCGGRGIKSQAEFGNIYGTKFHRTALGSMARVGTMPEIDFQVGGGLVSSIECQYQSSTPSHILQASGHRQSSANKISTGLTVQGVKVSLAGTRDLEKFMAIGLWEQLNMTVNVSDVDGSNARALLTNFCTINGTTTSQQLFLRINNISWSMTNNINLVTMMAAATPTYLWMSNIANVSKTTTCKFMGGTTAGITLSTGGLNVRVTT